MDLTEAIQYGFLVGAAYDVFNRKLSLAPGQSFSAGIPPNTVSYQLIASMIANDLATDLKDSLGLVPAPVSIGLIFQSVDTGEAVVAIRGTDGILEWVQDAKFLTEPCPFLPSAGNTEDGFTDMYKSTVMDAANGSKPVAGALSGLPWAKQVSSLTICGHSLGGALATLLALDVAANGSAPFNNPVAYTYASPKTGDPQFVNVYNHMVPNTNRIANRLDLVPKLPLPPLYEHVLGLFELNPVLAVLPPKFRVKPEIPCQHFLHSYLFLLSVLAGGTLSPLDPPCVP
ncbi:MAG TPA: lipase family protein [Candidatus Acidoferrum sp.]|nr:lipase family protein [Candidatus Acidoferrum sp.]